MTTIAIPHILENSRFHLTLLFEICLFFILSTFMVHDYRDRN